MPVSKIKTKHTNVIRVGGVTSGGGGYLTRVIKAAQSCKFVEVEVGFGAAQDIVFNQIKREVALLNNVADTDFSVTIRKETV